MAAGGERYTRRDTMDILGWAFLVVLGVLALSAVAITVAALWEKQRVRPFAPAESGGVLAEPTPYLLAQERSAEASGLTRCGSFGDTRGGLYRLRVSLWVDDDARTLAVIGGGTIARTPFRRTMLLSRLDDGRVLYTVDEFEGKDLSGLYDAKVLMNADLVELWSAHQQRLAGSGTAARRLDPRNALAELDAVESERLRLLLDRGLARWVDISRGTWRFSVKGAFLMGTLGFLGQLALGFEQQERTKLKRPGAGGGR